MKAGAPSELAGLYSMCKTFNKLPSEIEEQDPWVMGAFMEIEAALASKARNDQRLKEFEDKMTKKK